MRILLLSHSFNSLTQRLFVELRERGHEVTVELDVKDSVTIEAVELARPDVVIAPFLKRAIPPQVFERVPCLVVHPGPPGDRGPSALDWAILRGEKEWGVTVLQATAELDGGPIWASAYFTLRETTKSSLYRNEVTEAAMGAVLQALEKLPSGKPEPSPSGTWRPLLKQAERAIDWAQDDTRTVLRKIRSADGTPGLLDSLFDRPVYLHDAQPAAYFGTAGALLGQSGHAICRATRDGAVWIGHLRWKDDDAVKLPATLALGALARNLPHLEGLTDVSYEEHDGVGYVHFPFHNGAMSTERCKRLLAIYRDAVRRPTKVLVLTGGPDFWSNGIHLNTIESADSPADESWRNIEAMDDVVEAILRTTDRLVVAALQGNAGAGGVFLALAADRVWARDGVVLNPHYKGMGNLYGSEYWTYVLPRRCGEARAQEVTRARLPMGTAEAERLGLVDAHFGRTPAQFLDEVRARAKDLAQHPELAAMVAQKRAQLAADEARTPLATCRREELEHMRLNFYGFDPSYHVARYNFVRKVPKSRTPLYLAAHRRR